MRRLNRTEYCNTLVDLLAASPEACASIPGEDGAAGFDTVTTILTVSPLHVESYERVTGLALDRFFALAPEHPARARVFTCDPGDGASCVRELVRGFGRRAWRRPLKDGEIADYGTLFAAVRAVGATPAEALKATLQAMLLSPHFAFRLEVDVDPAGKQIRALDAHELATRLSYAVWATLPDDELMRVADDGTLTTQATLERQIGRLLDHPKARSLIDNFAAQWLHTRDVTGRTPDPRKYPAFSQELQQAMIAEQEAFVTAFLRGERSYKEMVTADFTVGVGDKLAAFYGIGPQNGSGERSLAQTARRGLLGQAAFHVVSSHGDETSVVGRGVWVMENVICVKPVEPPPDVPPLPANPGKKTKRQLSEEHRTSPACAPCHVWIDPIGLGLENYDVIGAWRTVDEHGNPVEAVGELPGSEDGSKVRFEGPLELARLLGTGKQFERCVPDRFLTYALGHHLKDSADGPAWIDAVVDEAARRGGTLRDVIVAALTSPPFRTRRSEGRTP